MEISKVQEYDKRLYFSLKPMKVVTSSFLLLILIASSALSREKSKDTTDYNLPQPVTYIEFLARWDAVAINYEPVLFYDSTAFAGAGVRGGLQIGVGTNLLIPFFGIRFDVPIVPILVLGKEYGFEIGAGVVLEWWATQYGGDVATYNSVKLTGVIGYRHYFFGNPHHLFRVGFSPTLQANGLIRNICYFSFGI
ncbi:MAG: hypothetical protein U0264_13145 [Candidatus Kapaibacterium sp.]